MKAPAIPLICLLAACGPPPEVDWSGYHPSVKDRIDRLAAAHDCAELQREFDTANANSDAQRNRAGRGNALLMDYIDVKLRSVGCYD